MTTSPFDWDAAREQVRRASDLHTIKASQIFEVPYEQVTPKQRAFAKATNFTEFYRPPGLQQRQDFWGVLCLYGPGWIPS